MADRCVSWTDQRGMQKGRQHEPDTSRMQIVPQSENSVALHGLRTARGRFAQRPSQAQRPASR